MNFKQLECFIEVAESLNFTAASSHLFLSQPTVTHQIKSLENELNVTLFLRTKKNVSLTPAGESFYTDAKELVSRMLIAKKKAADHYAKYSEKLAFGYSNTAVENSLLPYLLEAFRKRHPSIYIFLKQLHYKELITHLSEKKMDFIFTYSKDSIPQNDAVFFPLLQSEYFVLSRQELFLSSYDTVTIQDLKEQPVILPETSSCPTESKPLISLIKNTLAPSRIHYCDSPKTAFLLMKSGLGIAILPTFDIPSSNGIWKKQLSGIPSLSYGIAYMKHSPAKKYSHEIIHDCTEYFHSSSISDMF